MFFEAVGLGAVVVCCLIGLMLLGAVAGGMIGFNTVPRDALTTETGGELQPS